MRYADGDVRESLASVYASSRAVDENIEATA
jgi:hypothetical protein